MSEVPSATLVYMILASVVLLTIQVGWLTFAVLTLRRFMAELRRKGDKSRTTPPQDAHNRDTYSKNQTDKSDIEPLLPTNSVITVIEDSIRNCSCNYTSQNTKKNKWQPLKDTHNTHLQVRIGKAMVLLGLAGMLVFGNLFIAAGIDQVGIKLEFILGAAFTGVLVPILGHRWFQRCLRCLL